MNTTEEKICIAASVMSNKEAKMVNEVTLGIAYQEQRWCSG